MAGATVQRGLHALNRATVRLSRCGDGPLFRRPHPRRCLPVGVVLVNGLGLALLVEKYLADPRRVPQAFTGFGVFRDMRHHLHGAAAGEPVEWGARRVEPAVEAVEPFQQARWEFVLDAAAGDLPELGAGVAMADQHFVDERVMHVAREDDVVTRCAGVAEDIQDHLGGAAMRHPVFGVDQQRVAAPTEHFLHGLDQLDAKDRRGGDDDCRRVVQQRLLQFAQGFPVQQAGRLLEVEFAAPAAGAGVEHHQRGGGRQHVMPLLEGQQRVDQLILRTRVQVVVLCLGDKRLGLVDQRAKYLRLVAPALAQQVSQQRVTDDAFGERMAVGGFFPLRAEVPVVGDVVIIAVDMDVCMDNAWRAECTRPMKLPIHVRMDMIPTWTDVPSVSISCRELRAGCCLQLITRLNAAFIQVGTRDASSILSSILLSEFFNIYINLQRPTIFSERW